MNKAEHSKWPKNISNMTRVQKEPIDEKKGNKNLMRLIHGWWWFYICTVFFEDLGTPHSGVHKF